MKCPNCGNEIPDGSNFCMKCGTKLLQQEKRAVANNKVYNGCLIGVILAIFLVLVVIIGGIGDSDASKEKETTDINTCYNQAVSLAKQGKWHDCNIKLVQYKDKDNRCKMLYDYGQAQEQYANGNIHMADVYIKNIPDDYNGNFASDIKQFKDTIYPLEATYEEQEKQQEKEKAAERANHIYVGDHESKINDVFGTPDSVNRTVVGNHVNKQYVYDRGNKRIYIYTEDGTVTSFQD